MASDYEGIKIPKKIGIVEKYNGQGYVVYPDDKKMIESARNWAGTSYMLDTFTVNEKGWRVYDRAEYDPKLYIYDNGQFELTVAAGAESSCSISGKLSFWNCTIKAPDGKEFLIGINSDALASLIKNSDMHRGKVEQKVWLGRRKTNVVAYTDLMEEFQQAMKDEKLRNVKKTSKYAVGDIVKTLTTKDIYCGEFYKYIDEEFDRDPDDYWHKKLIVTIHSSPKTVHVFKSASYAKDTAKTFEDYFIDSEGALWGLDLLKNRPAKMLTDKKIKGLTTAQVFNAWVKEPPEKKQGDFNYRSYLRDLTERRYRKIVYGIDPTKLPDTDEVKAVFEQKIKEATSNYDDYYKVDKLVIRFD